MERTLINRTLKENIQHMGTLLPIDRSFDLIQRDLLIGGRESCCYFVNGFTKEDAMIKIMDAFYQVKEEAFPSNPEIFIKANLPYVEVEILQSFDEVIISVLSGITCLFVDGYEKCIAIDCRTYPSRSVEEPEKDKSLRGSRDGFVETIVYNTVLLRRRIRDTSLVIEMQEIGKSSQTDVALCYMDDRVDQTLLKQVKKHLNQMKEKDLKMNLQSLAEGLYARKWFDPLPKFKYTERPDTASACLLEGKVVILVDNSPSALILPTSIYDMIEEANDHYFPPITSIYLKISRALITFLTVFFLPTFLLLIQNPKWIPGWLQFIKIEGAIQVPIIFQILILELAIDGLRLAALNTPSMLSTPLSVIAGIVMGEFSVESGWFSSEVMLYMAFVSVANYTQPNFELGYALKFMRLALLILTALFNWIGFLAGCIFVVVSVCMNRTISGRSYLSVKIN